MIKMSNNDKIKVTTQDYPLLRFLLWSSPSAEVIELSEAEARNLYLRYEEYMRLVKPSELEKKLIERLLYGII
jgi:hypothetical protein